MENFIFRAVDDDDDISYDKEMGLKLPRKSKIHFT